MEPRQKLTVITAVAAVITLACIYGIAAELGKERTWNAITEDYIGGPDPSMLFILGVAGIAACATAVWATRVRAKYPEDS